MPRRVSAEPQSDVAAAWRECAPATAGGFSAVGYYFGRYLRRVRNVPVGLINSFYGGTPAQAWTSRPALDAEPTLRALAEKYDAEIQTWTPEKGEVYYWQLLATHEKAVQQAAAARAAPAR